MYRVLGEGLGRENKRSEARRGEKRRIGEGVDRTGSWREETRRGGEGRIGGAGKVLFIQGLGGRRFVPDVFSILLLFSFYC